MSRARLRRRRPWREVGRVLESFLARFPRHERRRRDPVALVHEHAAQEDREVAALVASSLAFGRASQAIDSARRVLDVLGPRPADAVRAWGTGSRAACLGTWRHRWVTGTDVAALLSRAGELLRRHDTLEAAFDACRAPDDPAGDLAAPMRRFAEALGPPAGESSRGWRFLVPRPRPAAAKRLCLFLRWLSRPADGVDLGAWRTVSPSELTIPLDTHVARIGRYLGLTDRATPGWAMAREITANLSRFDAADPTRFDFALAHLGIMGGCPRRRDPRTCRRCDLLAACRL